MANPNLYLISRTDITSSFRNNSRSTRDDGCEIVYCQLTKQNSTEPCGGSSTSPKIEASDHTKVKRIMRQPGGVTDIVLGYECYFKVFDRVVKLNPSDQTNLVLVTIVLNNT